MVYPKHISKVFLQPIDNLRRKRNLRQKIQHLLASIDGLLDEFDIDFCLTARSHAVKQHRLVHFKSRLDAVVCFLLGFRKLYAVHIGLHLKLLQSAHLALIHFENAFVCHGFQYRGSGIGLLQQRFGHNVVVGIATEGDKSQQHLQLLVGTLGQRVHQLMKFGLVAIFGAKSHKTLVFGFVFLVQLLLYHEDTFLHHAVYQWHHLLETDDFAHFADRDFRLDLQGFHDEVLEVVQGHGVEDVIR